MNNPQEQIVRELPYLRRYARALTGSQERGDRYVRVCLEALVAEPEYLRQMDGTRRQIYRLFHDVWRITDDRIVQTDQGLTTQSALLLERAISELTLPKRQILILVSLENFSISDAAYILAIDVADATSLFEEAKQELVNLAKADVLIIEDEMLIAMSIGDIVKEMGHNVVGVASRADTAVALAKQTRPGLILADIQLEGGTSGITAAQEILRTVDAPVIFVTAHPELLLTGEGEEPAFLLTKPFEPLALKTTISQALSLRSAA